MMMTADQTKKPLLEVQNLKQHFPIKGGILGRTVNHVKAVDDVSFTIFEGETLSIVGESGCGKSTTGRAILRLDEPTSGSVFFEGKDLLAMSKSQMRSMRKDLQVIFQDPFASLNPRQSVAQILGEALAIQNIVPANQRRERIIELLSHVGLRPDQIDRFPHEFSGGQRQRIGIARALAMQPKLIICDEAVSALDVSIQAQVLNLLKSLQKEFKLTYLFISHDLGVVRHISDRVMVMYLGKVVEIADKKSLFDSPQHPYTQALLSAIPVPDVSKKQERIILRGDVPSPINPPQGCRFHTRCPLAVERCKTEVPALTNVHSTHQVACHLVP
ncbi:MULTISPECIES: ABC transporter ATP-binding protein [Brevibacillus]|jgi:oligopeptide/dipeptide ABC transporter ATP-binding protein|uniref:Peptide ABC transporter ATP-binding protein n=1 Tax=Brevibacillus parabrevis TaxID=54914 RepID=A0A4Y3PX42_BREPA|nr:MULTISPECIES: dipeptide ABC transporter ATP-binding protein [Brevibacillus]MDR5002359.1 dipeptide ABC transporter ATP-binding protein [Brevibacillus parabrevis]MED1723419.1 dipeptide ABC transporter ATP-binding protein [Brevibacillus parabrevis]MED2256416.1 dipeptide ABC transporter ATP-binding protein [Brevibacillus parabrevis]RNB96828.1 dipeptide ABC transporter ATP-binding protein [Brevibacillus parabrevis]GEB35531.1 peptide ABC transporter ATP-binding protein [Brevibacillus parabrevis]